MATMLARPSKVDNHPNAIPLGTLLVPPFPAALLVPRSHLSGSSLIFFLHNQTILIRSVESAIESEEMGRPQPKYFAEPHNVRLLHFCNYLSNIDLLHYKTHTYSAFCQLYAVLRGFIVPFRADPDWHRGDSYTVVRG